MGNNIHIKFSDYINENNSEDVKLNDNFYKWFGDSKIVDKNGQPLEVYHGSQFDFKEFYPYSFFTEDYMNADGYGGGEYLYEVYLKIDNPLIIDCKGRKWDEIDTPYGDTTQEVLGTLNKNKYDGVIFNNIKDSWIDDVGYQDSGTVYGIVNPKQIKSIHNDGSWDVNDKNIYS